MFEDLLTDQETTTLSVLKPNGADFEGTMKRTLENAEEVLEGGGKDNEVPREAKLDVTSGQLDIDSENYKREILLLREGTRLQALDVIKAALDDRERLVTYEDYRFGEQTITKFGGLQSFLKLSEEQLDILCQEDDSPTVLLDGNHVIAGYIVSSNLARSGKAPPSRSEDILLEGESCFRLLSQKLQLKNYLGEELEGEELKKAEEAKKRSLQALREGKGAHTGSVMTSVTERNRGLGTLVKTVALKRLLQQGVRDLTFEKFAVVGLSTKKDPNVPLYTFDPPILNQRGLDLNTSAATLMGIIPLTRSITDLTSADVGELSLDGKLDHISRMLRAVERDDISTELLAKNPEFENLPVEYEDLRIMIHNLVFGVDLGKAVIELEQKVRNRGYGEVLDRLMEQKN